MNKSLSLLICLSLAFPAYAMEEETPFIRPRTSLAARAWEAISCKKVFLTVTCLLVLGFLSTGGYFVTNTCLRMNGACTTIQSGCNTIQGGCDEMKSACTNCTQDLGQVHCGLMVVDSIAILLKKLIAQYPAIAAEYALELSHLNTSLNCH